MFLAPHQPVKFGVSNCRKKITEAVENRAVPKILGTRRRQ